MRKLLIVGLLVLISAGIFILINTKVFGLIPQKGMLDIQSQPSSAVFVNGEDMGKTPLQSSFQEGEYTVKLISHDTPESPAWESSISVIPKAESIINVYFGSSPSDISSEKLYFKPIERKGTQVTIISEPDFAQVYIDGTLSGTTPLSLDSISPGEHTIRLVLPEYQENELKIETKKGYLLNIDVTLRSSNPSSQEATSSAKQKNSSVKIEIVSPDTGWLRVRNEPSRTSEELGKVDNGKTFEVIEEQEEWIKIEYEEGKMGWISGEYTKKIEESKSN